MSDNNITGENATQASQNGSSSESSDVSIEKLNPEESDITESKPAEDDDKEKDTEAGAHSITTKENKSDDPSNLKDKVEASKSGEEKSKKSETVSSPSTSSSQVAVRDITSIDDSEDEDEDDDFEDETLIERLVGLTEMFPPGLMTGISNLSLGSINAVKWSYSAGRTVTWIICSSAALLFLPAMLESERVAIEEQDKMRKQQMLLGPSSALASAQNAPLPPNPA